MTDAEPATATPDLHGVIDNLQAAHEVGALITWLESLGNSSLRDPKDPSRVCVPNARRVGWILRLLFPTAGGTN